MVKVLQRGTAQSGPKDGEEYGRLSGCVFLSNMDEQPCEKVSRPFYCLSFLKEFSLSSFLSQKPCASSSMVGSLIERSLIFSAKIF